MYGFIKMGLLDAGLALAIINLSVGRALYNPAKTGAATATVAAAYPYAQIAEHNAGKIGLSITNFGQIGSAGLMTDPVTEWPSCRYPASSWLEYLYGGALWIGAVVDGDTLVSVGWDGWQQIHEMWPDALPGGKIVTRSINDGDPGAISEQDFIAVYTDTLTDSIIVTPDPFDGRPHKSLNIEITQKSYAWSYEFAEDFVIFDCSLKNIGGRTLRNVYMGVFIDADVAHLGTADGFKDDICGFRRTVASPTGCGFEDTINIAWIADNDGKASNATCPYDAKSVTSVTGVRLLRSPSDSLRYSFNWWVSNSDSPLDFGPRLAGTPWDPFRDFGGFLGTPEGDRNKYYILRHEEFDYDQLFAVVNHTAEGWLPPPAQAESIAGGGDTKYLLSFGPYDISPGEILPLVFAYVAGENFHTDCSAFGTLFNPSSPQTYYNYLNFADLGKNTMWASWVYDVPGVDTDGDGYRGKYRICGGDTVFYEGDAVPDWYAEKPTDIGETPGGQKLPDGFRLFQNSPNPFNAATRIAFELAYRKNITLNIFNLRGQLVRTFSLGERPAGQHTIVWDGADENGRPVASGVYFYKLTAGSYAASREMILLK